MRRGEAGATGSGQPEGATGSGQPATGPAGLAGPADSQEVRGIKGWGEEEEGEGRHLPQLVRVPHPIACVRRDTGIPRGPSELSRGNTGGR